MFVAGIACMCCSLLRMCRANSKRLLRIFLLGPICTAFAAHYFHSLCATVCMYFAVLVHLLRVLFACAAHLQCIYCVCVWRMFCCSYCAHMLGICACAVPILCFCGPIVVRFVVGPSPLQKRGQSDPFPLKQRFDHHFVPVTLLRGASWGRR